MKCSGDRYHNEKLPSISIWHLLNKHQTYRDLSPVSHGIVRTTRSTCAMLFVVQQLDLKTVRDFSRSVFSVQQRRREFSRWTYANSLTHERGTNRSNFVGWIGSDNSKRAVALKWVAREAVVLVSYETYAISIGRGLKDIPPVSAFHSKLRLVQPPSSWVIRDSSYASVGQLTRAPVNWLSAATATAASQQTPQLSGMTRSKDRRRRRQKIPITRASARRRARLLWDHWTRVPLLGEQPWSCPTFSSTE